MKVFYGMETLYTKVEMNLIGNIKNKRSVTNLMSTVRLIIVVGWAY